MIMAIGERIHFIRNLRGMTQKYLGMAVGFPEKSADVRLAQYETGARTPKADLKTALAKALDVSPNALSVPNIDTYIGLLHTLFALEDMYGLTVGELDGEVCLRLGKHRGTVNDTVFRMLEAWHDEAAKLETGEITKEQYDNWRYKYPALDTTHQWQNIPSNFVNDLVIEAINQDEK
jgi:transcriptional regulator with XRE-family HTH domain